MPEAIDLNTMSGAGIAAKAIEVMGTMQGKPYTFGGKTTNGFDCSGFVAYVFTQTFPNAAAALAGLNASSIAASPLFVEVDESERQAGDIIYFPGSGTKHIGIVVDDEFWVGSQSSTGVAKVKFTNPYWSAKPHKYKRFQSVSPVSVMLGRGNASLMYA
jgi:cell wall-associated NlpC family hydrolase